MQQLFHVFALHHWQRFEAISDVDRNGALNHRQMYLGDFGTHIFGSFKQGQEHDIAVSAMLDILLYNASIYFDIKRY